MYFICQDVSEQVYKLVPRQKCYWKRTEVCNDVPDEACNDVPDEACNDVPRKRCTPVPVQCCKPAPKKNVPLFQDKNVIRWCKSAVQYCTAYCNQLCTQSEIQWCTDWCSCCCTRFIQVLQQRSIYMKATCMSTGRKFDRFLCIGESSSLFKILQVSSRKSEWILDKNRGAEETVSRSRSVSV